MVGQRRLVTYKSKRTQFRDKQNDRTCTVPYFVSVIFHQLLPWNTDHVALQQGSGRQPLEANGILASTLRATFSLGRWRVCEWAAYLLALLCW